MVFFAACLIAAAEPESSSEVMNDGVSVRFQVEGTVDHPFAAVDAVIGDPANYPHWIPIFKKAEHLQGPHWNTLWQLPWPLGKIQQRMRFVKQSTDDGVQYLFEQESGDMRRHVGLWAVSRIDATHTSVLYQAEVAFNSWLPRSLIASFQRKELPKLMRHLSTEIESRTTGGAPPKW